MRRLVTTTGLAVLAVTLLLSGVATAGPGPTRAEYVEGLETICKPRALATERATEGSREDIDSERLGVAAGKFARATQIYSSTLAAIASEPRPAADAPRLSKWFSYLKRQQSYLKEITAALRADQAIKAQRLTARFIHNGNLANNVVLEFGFNYCSFKFSRFG